MSGAAELQHSATTLASLDLLSESIYGVTTSLKSMFSHKIALYTSISTVAYPPVKPYSVDRDLISHVKERLELAGIPSLEF